MAENRLRARSIAAWSTAAVLTLFASWASSPELNSSDTQVASIGIPRGSASKINGKLIRKEWTGAQALSIGVAPGWSVQVLLKHDDRNLFFAFQGLEKNGKRMFPEILIDPEARRGKKWSAGQWWLHVSNNLYEGDGEYNVYERSGVFQCAHSKAGWEASNPPGKSETIEVRVSFEKLKLSFPRGKMIGLALDVTDATGDASQVYRYWPAGAQIARPESWGKAVIE